MAVDGNKRNALQVYGNDAYPLQCEEIKQEQRTALLDCFRTLLNPPLPPDVKILPIDIATVAQKRAFLSMALCGHEGLLRLIVIYL